jgi:hypothetical protein
MHPTVAFLPAVGNAGGQGGSGSPAEIAAPADASPCLSAGLFLHGPPVHCPFLHCPGAVTLSRPGLAPPSPGVAHSATESTGPMSSVATVFLKSARAATSVTATRATMSTYSTSPWPLRLLMHVPFPQSPAASVDRLAGRPRGDPGNGRRTLARRDAEIARQPRPGFTRASPADAPQAGQRRAHWLTSVLQSAQAFVTGVITAVFSPIRTNVRSKGGAPGAAKTGAIAGQIGLFRVLYGGIVRATCGPDGGPHLGGRAGKNRRRFFLRRRGSGSLGTRALAAGPSPG